MAEPRAKVLVVDDEVRNVKLLEAMLLPRGYEVVKAYDGEDALQQTHQEQPDLILLDVMMPKLDGFEVCRTLKANEETRLIPIVIMTSLGQVDDRIKGIEAGANDFLTKPVNQKELMARIETELKLKHTVDRKIGELRQLKDYFAQFVPEAVKRLSTDPEALRLAEKHEQDGSVLFLNISGYAELSERVPPEVLNTLVEYDFFAFLDRIREAGGDINESGGEGFMVIFQEMDYHRHASKAVDTALALLAAVEALNEENREQPLALSIGINTGPVLVGSHRFEGLRGTRWTLTASGPVTDLATELAGVAEAGQILVGLETAQRLEGDYYLEKLDPEHLKDLSGAVDIHRVLGPSPTT